MKRLKQVRKLLITFLVFVFIASLFSGCGSENKENTAVNNSSTTESSKEVKADQATLADNSDAFKDVQLTLWNGFTGPDGKGFQNIINDFNKMYDGKINIKVQTMQWGAFYDKIVTAVASGKSPEVAVMHLDSIPRFAKKGILLDLEEKSSKLGLKESDFLSGVWKAGVYESKRYGIPLDVHPIGLYYNKDLLKKAGFDNPPTNLDEFLAMSKAMTKDTDGDGTIDEWGFAMPTLWPNQQIFWTALHQFGGKATNADATEGLYNTPEAVNALQLLVDIVYKHKISPENIQADGELTLFKQGKVGFIINGIWEIQSFKDQTGLNFGAAPVPKFGSQDAVWANSHNFVLFKQKSPDSIKEDAAMLLIDYVTSHSLEWAKAGQVPARNSIRSSKEFTELKEQSEFAKQVDYIVFPVTSPSFPDCWGPSGEAVTNSILGRSQVKPALDLAVKKGMKLVEANK